MKDKPHIVIEGNDLSDLLYIACNYIIAPSGIASFIMLEEGGSIYFHCVRFWETVALSNLTLM